MLSKDKIRIKFLKIRKKNYYEISEIFFRPVLKLLKKLFKNKKIFISIYYPSNYEVNALKFLDIAKGSRKIAILLPKISSKNNLSFHTWSSFEQLNVNKFGMLEPDFGKRKIIPHVILLPLLAFDKKNNRIGYGKGYYDRFLNKCSKKKIKIITIGVAFSFQKYNKLPITKTDVELDYILTEKGLKKI